jgi:transposase
MHTIPPFPPELWEQTPVAVQASIRALEARVAAVEATVERVLERVQQDSRHASRPPSRDPPHVLGQRSRRGPSGRKRGGHPGPQGQTRALLPMEDVDAVAPVTPRQCPRGQHPLQGEDPQPPRHQVTALPPVKPVVTA